MVHLKGTKKFDSKVINTQLFHGKTVFQCENIVIINFTAILLSITDCYLNETQEKDH